MIPRNASASPILLRFLALLLLLTATGCGAKLSAAHLQRKPWQEGASQTIAAKFMRFEVATVSREDGFELKGTAWAVRENLPPWADTASNLTIHAYLCDENGAVLAHTAKQYPTQKLAASGIPVHFTLGHGKPPPGGYFVSLGYSGMFTSSARSRQAGQGDAGTAASPAFFASEQAALTK